MKNSNLFVVGIGASAGGLDAIRNMFDTMPEDTGLAFVIVQHLSPDFKSLMPELLAKHTRIPIYTVKHNQEVKPNTIYLNQRNTNLKLENKHFKLSDKEPRGQLNLPIDVFFHSLGNEYKENAVGVVLSGTGTDSSRRIKTIKEEGGTIIVQNPSSAQFDGMPNAAISTNLADYILKPEEMAGVIAELPNKRFFIDTHVTSQETNEKKFIDILSEIHKASAVDFRKYKRNTLLRRLEKRMAINNIESLEKYLNYIKTNKDEIKKVGQDFLIQVTSFFRDNEVFEKLQKEIIPKVIKAAEKNETIRIWVPACSSGEEAFSIAIVIDDVISSMNKIVDFK
ncbi:MAG TPA: chemotaxis protein CheB, partial [Prolixibacteraceae bacterium]|nr:chemotaxis protein CheB [Prolixibacteraceae bacterium]